MDYMSVLQIQDHPMNEKIYSVDEQQDRELEQSIREYGIISPIIINQHNFIVSGHRRFKAAKAIGLEAVPVSKKRFDTTSEEVLYLIASNEYRIKTNEDRIREGKKIAEIMAKDPSSGGRLRDRVGKEIGISGRSFEKGEAVVKAIDALEEADPEKAEALREKLNKSIDSAHKAVVSGDIAVADDITEEEAEEELAEVEAEAEKRASDARLFFYWRPLKAMLAEMEHTYIALAKRRNSTTPAALGAMIGNIKEMVIRLQSWDPRDMADCPSCKGTGKLATVNANGEEVSVACLNCLNGKVGLSKKSDY